MLVSGNATGVPKPDEYQIQASPHCPSNLAPVLVYRGVLSEPLSEDSVSEHLQRHGWVKMGTWGAIPTKHFHPNTHECYGVFQGTSELVFGEGGADIRGSGVRCQVKAGDVIVIPAGVAHATIDEDMERENKLEEGARYRYIGVYPVGAPQWRSDLGKEALVGPYGEEIVEETSSVPVPELDPVWGLGGPLPQIWNSAKQL